MTQLTKVKKLLSDRRRFANVAWYDAILRVANSTAISVMAHKRHGGMPARWPLYLRNRTSPAHNFLFIVLGELKYIFLSKTIPCYNRSRI